MPLTPAPRASATQRVAALLLDYLVILGWMALLAVGSLVVALLSGGYPDVLGALGPVAAQAVFFLVLTLPVGLYLYLCESSSAQASWGKRRLGLIVTRTDGERPSRGQIAVRTVVKLLPWEVAHTFIWQMQAVFHRSGYDADVPAWIFAGLNVVLIAIVVYLATSLLGDRRGPHDRAASTVVTASGALTPAGASSS